MISLTCTSCQKVLQIDDAFAGGVCRCQYCGTIQTVPASLKKDSRGGSGAPVSKTLYQRKNRASRGQTAPPPAAETSTAGPAPEPKRETMRAAHPVAAAPKRDLRQLRPVLIIAGVAIVLVAGIIFWVTRGS